LKFAHPVTESDPNVAEVNQTTQKVSAEEKITMNKMTEFGGWDVEAKWKNDGSLSYDCKSDILAKTEVDGLRDAQITVEGKASRA
jgi:hypothetical protein